MHPNRAGRIGLLAALCAAVVSSAALAGGAVRGETTLLVRTSAGAIERLVFEGELIDGERRGLTAASGNPATLARNAEGLVLELAGERFDVALPEVEVSEDGATTIDGPRRIVIHRHEDRATEPGAAAATTETRKVIKIVRHGEPAEGETAEAEATAMALADGDPEALLLAGEGPRVLVLRRIVHHDGTP
jgi:hypothetical protein